MKKVTIMALHLNYGGVEKFICDLANTFSSDYQVVIATTYRLCDRAFFSLNDNVEVIYLTDYKPNRQEFYAAVNEKKIGRIISEAFKALKTLYAKNNSLIKYVQKMKTDIVITTRKEQSEIVERYCNDSVLKIATEHNHHNNDKKYVKQLYKSTKNMDKLVLLSKSLHKFYTKLFSDDKVECECIEHFVNINTNVQEKRDKSVISVGRLSYEKGFNELLDIAKSSKDIQYSLIGEGSERDLLEQRIESEYIDNVNLLGSMSFDQITQKYLRNSIFLMTSHSESFGLALIEAMACGLPCIAFDSAKGPKEIIEDGVNGCFVSNRDVSKMADIIKELLNNENELERLREGAFETANKYSYDKFKRKWLDIVK